MRAIPCVVFGAVLATAAVLPVGCDEDGEDFFYGLGYDDGYDDGIDDGFDDGWEEGADDGYADGYHDAAGGWEYDPSNVSVPDVPWDFDISFTDYGHGYDKGYDDGYSDGFYQGYLAGYATWYDVGYEDGL